MSGKKEREDEERKKEKKMKKNRRNFFWKKSVFFLPKRRWTEELKKSKIKIKIEEERAKEIWKRRWINRKEEEEREVTNHL